MGRWESTARKKQSQEETRTRRKSGRREEMEKVRRDKMQVREKVRRSRNTKRCVFPLTCGSGGSKSRLPKAAGAEPAGQMKDEHLHAVVARSTCASQNVESTSASEHF